MATVFVPHELIKVLESIKKDHPKNGSGSLDANYQGLHQLVLQIAACRPEALIELAYSLPLSAIRSLAKYFPSNGFQIDRANLAEILMARLTHSIFESYLNAWQDHYDDPTNQVLLHRMIRELLTASRQEDHKSQLVMIEALSNNPSIDEEIYQRSVNLRLTVRETLEKFHLRPMSRLALHAYFAEYYTCPTATFKKIKEQTFLGHLRQMNNKQLTQSLNNLLSVADMEVFERYQPVANYIKSTYGKPGNVQSGYFWDEITPDNQKRFHMWLNLVTILEFFEGERADFWKRFVSRCRAISSSYKHGRIFLDFGAFHVVEFRDVGRAGFILDAKIYDQHIQQYEESDVKNDDIRRKILDGDLYLDRILHHSGWQYKVARTVEVLLSRNEVRHDAR